MPRFFVESVSGGQVILTGPDAAHMCRSLRMKPGDTVTLCDTQGFDYQCVVQRLSPEEAALTIIDKHQCENEPSLSVILYQGLPKGEKMDWIVQKAVELGVSQIVPVRMAKNRGGSCQAVRTGDSPPGLPSRGFSPSTDSGSSGRGIFILL